MLKVRELTKRFGGFTALNAVSFEVQQGEILGLIGPNGSGKTTAFNCISGALPPTARLDPLRRTARSAASRRTRSATSGVARTFQIPRPFRKLSILENVAVAAHYGAASATTEAEARRRAREVLDAGRPARRSGTPTDAARRGRPQEARAGARAGHRSDAAAGRREPGRPGSGRDGGAAEMLRRVRGELGITIVWVEHIMATLMRVVDRVVVLDHGEKIAEGAPARGRGGPAR